MNWSLAAYSALAWAAQPLLRRKLRRRAQAEPGYGESVGERFGRYAPADLGRDGDFDQALLDVDGDGEYDLIGEFKPGESDPYRYERIAK